MDASGFPVGKGQLNFDPDVLYLTVNLSVLGGDDGYVNAAALVGNITGPTDCVPNTGYLGLVDYGGVQMFLPLVVKQ